ncbi:MAG: hypothetical protein NTY29_04990 [Proteobacteria bacterium]|nr:hypothetical protein [Pseudomonadota bacterium]
MITNSYDRILNISSMVVEQEVEAAAIYPEKISSAQLLSGIGSIKILPAGHEQKERENNLLFEQSILRSYKNF